jgi:hypothetical protein
LLLAKTLSPTARRNHTNPQFDKYSKSGMCLWRRKQKAMTRAQGCLAPKNVNSIPIVHAHP